jgi:glucose/arabinose dehydrogenase
VHLRRALLLFAIVLGLAALAASVSRPGEESTEREAAQSDSPAETTVEEPPTASPGSSVDAGLSEVTFAAGSDDTRRLQPGPATVLVEVDEPGQVEIPDLGLSQSGEPLTPARFEIFASEPGRHEIAFTPADGDESRGVGTLVIEASPG